MPGMNGIETARKMRETIGDDVPILIISAYDWSSIEEEAGRPASADLSQSLCLNRRCITV